GPALRAVHTLSLADARPISGQLSRGQAGIAALAAFSAAALAPDPREVGDLPALVVAVLIGMVGKPRTTAAAAPTAMPMSTATTRSEEHTSELQSREKLVCRL